MGHRFIFRIGMLYRFYSVRLGDDYFVAVGLRSAHYRRVKASPGSIYKVTAYESLSPFYETWWYFTHKEFEESFDVLADFQLRELPDSLYKSYLSLTYDDLFLKTPPAGIAYIPARPYGSASSSSSSADLSSDGASSP